MIDANFIAVRLFLFHRHHQASLFFAPNENALDADKDFCSLVSAFETRSLPALASTLVTFYVDHSHCPVLAPATLAALPSTHALT